MPQKTHFSWDSRGMVCRTDSLRICIFGELVVPLDARMIPVVIGDHRSHPRMKHLIWHSRQTGCDVGQQFETIYQGVDGGGFVNLESPNWNWRMEDLPWNMHMSWYVRMGGRLRQKLGVRITEAMGA